MADSLVLWRHAQITLIHHLVKEHSLGYLYRTEIGRKSRSLRKAFRELVETIVASCSPGVGAEPGEEMVHKDIGKSFQRPATSPNEQWGLELTAVRSTSPNFQRSSFMYLTGSSIAVGGRSSASWVSRRCRRNSSCIPGSLRSHVNMCFTGSWGTPLRTSTHFATIQFGNRFFK